MSISNCPAFVRRFLHHVGWQRSALSVTRVAQLKNHKNSNLLHAHGIKKEKRREKPLTHFRIRDSSERLARLCKIGEYAFSHVHHSFETWHKLEHHHREEVPPRIFEILRGVPALILGHASFSSGSLFRYLCLSRVPHCSSLFRLLPCDENCVYKRVRVDVSLIPKCDRASIDRMCSISRITYS